MLRSLFFLFSFLITSQFYAQYNSNDWEERDQWMDVEELFELAGIQKGQHVADIGCHEGYFSMHLARKVGVRGKVFSVDVRDDRLEKLNQNASFHDMYP